MRVCVCVCVRAWTDFVFLFLFLQVARKYAEFEKLQEELSVEFSAIVFPSLPPRRLFCTEDDLEDRMVCVAEILLVYTQQKKELLQM